MLHWNTGLSGLPAPNDSSSPRFQTRVFHFEEMPVTEPLGFAHTLSLIYSPSPTGALHFTQTVVKAITHASLVMKYALWKMKFQVPLDIRLPFCSQQDAKLKKKCFEKTGRWKRVAKMQGCRSPFNIRWWFLPPIRLFQWKQHSCIQLSAHSRIPPRITSIWCYREFFRNVSGRDIRSTSLEANKERCLLYSRLNI